MGNKWISVKEKIPYCGGHFLVHDTNGHEYKAVFIDKHWQSRYPYPIKEWLEETEVPVSKGFLYLIANTKCNLIKNFE